MSDSLRPHEPQHARTPCPSPTPGVRSNSNQSSHPATSSSVVPFSSCPQSLPASESFPMSQLFAWGGRSTGVSALASVLPMNTQDWSPFEWTGWISLQSKGLSIVFSNITVQKHQFFGTQPSSSPCFSFNFESLLLPISIVLRYLSKPDFLNIKCWPFCTHYIKIYSAFKILDFIWFWRGAHLWKETFS